MLDVRWGDRLEALADALFADVPPDDDPLRSRVVVVGSHVVAGWLRQRHLYVRRGAQRVLANWDFVPLHQFVNDRLAPRQGPGARREPHLHPYSPECLRWRIDGLLRERRLPALAPLRRYIGDAPTTAARRRFDLAGQLARLFDDYQNYRADLLMAWEADGAAPRPPEQAWQCALWRALKRQQKDSYLDQFRALEDRTRRSALAAELRRVDVFHVTAMPVPYVHFFHCLSEVAAVVFHVFNPCRAQWLDDRPERSRRRGPDALTGPADDAAADDAGNPLLGSLGKACQSHLAELLDRTEGQAEAAGRFGRCDGNSLLERLQELIRDRLPAGGERRPHRAADPSIQLHFCHSPLREVECLRETLLAWFAEHPARRPRDVQVLVTDLDAYAPLIEAVFDTAASRAPEAIPTEIADRPKAGPGPCGMAFLTLLRLGGGRCPADELLDVLALDAVRATFDLSAEDVERCRELVDAAGIRWGLDGERASRGLGGAIADTATWRRGLDRLLLGYALGRPPGGGEPQIVEAGECGRLLACDAVEGDQVRVLDALLRFVAAFGRFSDEMRLPAEPAEWQRRLAAAVDTFFRATEATGDDLANLRRACAITVQTAMVAECRTLDREAVLRAIEESLATPPRGGTATADRVLFTPLRTMRPTPRRLLCLLGMTEGAFPRADARPTFHHMAHARRRGDRSVRLDDRLAFLEALMCARERLLISFVGLDQQTNAPCPPASVVAELQQFLADTFAEDPPAAPAPSAYRLFEVRHRLQACHPAYFTPGSGLTAFSPANYAAALALARARVAPARPDVVRTPPSPPPTTPTTPPPTHADAAHDTPAAAERDLAELQSRFENPARDFYTRVLLARLPRTAADAGHAEEVFELTALDGFRLHAALQRQLLADPAADDFQMFQEMGLLPLGAPGAVRYAQQRVAIARFLEAPVTDRGTPLRALLAPVAATAATTTTTPFVFRGGGGGTVRGSVRTVTLPGEGPLLVLARYGRIRPKDRLRAWLGHLGAHAAGVAPFTTLLVGSSRDTDPCTRLRMSPLTSADAASLLEDLLAPWLPDDAPLPFAPAASLAAAASLRRDSRTDAALTRARAPWRGSGRMRGECDDPYLFQAWGADGPMTHAAFLEVAQRFWAPHLAACEALDADDEPTDGEEDA